MYRPGRGALACALAVLAAAAVPAAAQTGAVAGRVVDEAGAPVPRAEVVLVPSGRGARSSADGAFRIQGIPAGRLELHASLVGYAPLRRSISVAAGHTTVLELRLERTVLSLEGVQVTGTIGSRESSAVAQATTQISGKALEREMGATLAQTLRAQPGLAVRSMGPAATAPVIRGLSGDRVLVLQDGQRSADLSGSADDHGVTIDPLVAQRVEVVRGPATLLYGNNALGGVVNVISGDIPTGPQGGREWSVGALTESAYPGGSATLRGTIPLGSAWALSARAGARRTGDMRIGDDPLLGDRLPNTDFRNRNAAVGVGRAGERGEGGAALRWYDFAYGLPVPGGSDPVSLEGRRLEALGRWEQSLDGGLLSSIRVDGTAQRYAHDELDPRNGSILQEFKLATGTANLLLRRGSTALGASGLWKGYDNTGPAALTPPAVSRSAGAFAFQEIALPAGAALEAGARFDRYEIASDDHPKYGASVRRVFEALSGSVGARVPFGGGASLGVSAARSFRAPTVEELFSGAAHAGTGAVEFGNPRLEAERGASLEAVLRVQSPRWTGQLATYRNAIDAFVHLQSRGDTLLGGVRLPVLEYGQAPAVLRGVEGSVEWAAGRSWVVGGMGDYVHAALEDGTPLSYMPPPRLGLLARWDDGRFSAGGDLHHELRQDRVGAAGEEPTDAHTLLRLTAGARLTLGGRIHSLTLRGENLTDAAHREATSRVKDFAPGAGRNLALVYRVIF